MSEIDIIKYSIYETPGRDRPWNIIICDLNWFQNNIILIEDWFKNNASFIDFGQVMNTFMFSLSIEELILWRIVWQ